MQIVRDVNQMTEPRVGDHTPSERRGDLSRCVFGVNAMAASSHATSNTEFGGLHRCDFEFEWWLGRLNSFDLAPYDGHSSGPQSEHNEQELPEKIKFKRIMRAHNADNPFLKICAHEAQSTVSSK
jgi:hypothetical protein